MTSLVNSEVLLAADNIERLRVTVEAMRAVAVHRIGEIEELQVAGDALAGDLRGYLIAWGVHDARETLAAWHEVRHGRSG